MHKIPQQAQKDVRPYDVLRSIRAQNKTGQRIYPDQAARQRAYRWRKKHARAFR